MTKSDVLQAAQDLSLREQFEVLESLARLLRERCPAESSSDRSQLEAAAEALRTDYQADPELTAFAALDSEDFHVAR